jgi:predicted small metal-binding protein
MRGAPATGIAAPSVTLRRPPSASRSCAERAVLIHKKARLVKTMTCNQLGGPCDYALQGNTADEVIKAQDKHLREIVASGDDSHESALKAMKGRWKHPVSGMGWYRAAKRAFAALPED